jgi:hypothetical protein
VGCNEILVWFGLHFSYDKGSWILLYVFIGHSYLFLWKFPTQFMYPFLHWVVDSEGWVFWAPCTFWILVPDWINS